MKRSWNRFDCAQDAPNSLSLKPLGHAAAHPAPEHTAYLPASANELHCKTSAHAHPDLLDQVAEVVPYRHLVAQLLKPRSRPPTAFPADFHDNRHQDRAHRHR